MTIIPWKRLNSSIRLIDGILTGIANLGQSGTGSNGNEEVPNIPQAKTEAWLSDAV